MFNRRTFKENSTFIIKAEHKATAMSVCEFSYSYEKNINKRDTSILERPH